MLPSHHIGCKIKMLKTPVFTADKYLRLQIIKDQYMFGWLVVVLIILISLPTLRESNPKTLISSCLRSFADWYSSPMKQFLGVVNLFVSLVQSCAHM